MSYLLDTDVLIELERRTPQALFAQVSAHAGQLFVSSISVAELQFGVAKSRNPAHMREALEALLTQLNILDFTTQDAVHAGEIRESLRREGKPIGPNDMLIAAQALTRGLVMVTGNTREFSRVAGLRVENWLEGN